MTRKAIFSRARALGVSSVVLFAFAAAPALAASVADEVIAAAKAQWAAEMAGKSTEEQMTNIASDYTEFNPDAPTRIDGKMQALRLSKAMEMDSTKQIAAEMANPRVQIYGDTAILTYNFIGVMQNKDGSTKPSLAKSTRVYVKEGGSWMLVHANFSPVEAR